jgi:hypothetical protein
MELTRHIVDHRLMMATDRLPAVSSVLRVAKSRGLRVVNCGKERAAPPQGKLHVEPALPTH